MGEGVYAFETREKDNDDIYNALDKCITVVSKIVTGRYSIICEQSLLGSVLYVNSHC